MKRKIIITYDNSEFKDFEAVTFVLNVIADTKESEPYSKLTSFTGKVQVSINEKNHADSFIVRKTKW